MHEFGSKYSWIHDYENDISMNSWIWIENSWTLWTWNLKLAEKFTWTVWAVWTRDSGKFVVFTVIICVFGSWHAKNWRKFEQFSSYVWDPSLFSSSSREICKYQRRDQPDKLYERMIMIMPVSWIHEYETNFPWIHKYESSNR